MRIIENCCLAAYNSYRVESFCKKAFFPNNEKELVQAIIASNNFKLIGSGNNVILSKTYYNSDFIIFNNIFNKIEVNLDTEIIIAEAGATFKDISTLALENSLTGLEFAYDIPSSVGGAIIMNAGTKEGETKDVLLKVRYLNLNSMLVEEKHKNDLELGYRNSMFQNQNDYIILKAWFQLRKGNKSSIFNTMKQSKERRWAKQPREYPNCGSVFKRPPNKFVGPMLDQLGLKGFTIGGAQVSEKHSGFIINYNQATGEDILMLIKHIQNKVKETFDIDLVVEQRIL